MKGCPKSILTFCFLLSTIFLFSQNEYLVIGRTTGKLFLKNNVPIRTFGFTNSLSGQVTLPGLSIEVVEGENVSIDFGTFRKAIRSLYSAKKLILYSGIKKM
ncbi:hypothetical protein ACHRVW_19890 [Flavobacterium collinsii]|uniref:hypothetical protein n=1 Tax=Flavobacterium collinsii TaxID=1114861 RepID=UPI003758397E